MGFDVAIFSTNIVLSTLNKGPLRCLKLDCAEEPCNNQEEADLQCQHPMGFVYVCVLGRGIQYCIPTALPLSTVLYVQWAVLSVSGEAQGQVYVHNGLLVKLEDCIMLVFFFQYQSGNGMGPGRIVLFFNRLSLDL